MKTSAALVWVWRSHEVGLHPVRPQGSLGTVPAMRSQGAGMSQDTGMAIIAVLLILLLVVELAGARWWWKW
jgi:hypothetical protein